MQSIKDLLYLLDLERKEDLRLYEQQIVRTPLDERKRKGVCWYPLRLTEVEMGTGEQYYLRVERTSHLGEPHAFQVGGLVSFFPDGDEGRLKDGLRGVVASVWKDNMVVAVGAEELPDWLRESPIGVDVLFDDLSYREMESALKRLKELPRGRSQQLRDVLMGEERPAWDPKGDASFRDLPELNASQNQSVRQVLRALDVAVVHGPPGTGKTTTLVQAVREVLRTEPQVLVSAPSNTAVDLLTEKLWAQGVKVLRLGNPARVEEELRHLSLDGQIESHPDHRQLRKLRKEAEEYRRLAGRNRRNFGPDEREQRRLLFAEARRTLQEAERVEEHIIAQLLDRAQVVLCTLVGASSRYLEGRRFRTLFIDEAAQALIPATWIPILLADRVILAGDPFQLPPTVKSQQAAEQGLADTLLEQVMGLHPTCATLLEVQYRMHAQIMAFSNQEFYDGRLQAAPQVAARTLDQDPARQSPFAAPVDFIDTAGCGFQEQLNPETMSRYNPEEAGVLLNYLAQVLGQYAQAYPDTPISVGIISPYKAQVMRLQQLLEESVPLRPFLPWIRISSVDGFQGQECDLVAISLVRNNPEAQIGFLSDTRRMNVAMTRARRKLVLVGESPTLGAHPFYRRFLDYIDRIGAYHSAWEFGGF